MIEGRVARILTERELIITRGRQDGVVVGMQFEVLARETLEVTDPETGESLGALDRSKVRVEATEIYDKFAICETVQLVDTGSGLMSPSDFFRPRRTLPHTLNAKESLPPLSEAESIVKVGDRVRQVSSRRAYSVRAV
jgi:hypothetical protein